MSNLGAILKEKLLEKAVSLACKENYDEAVVNFRQAAVAPGNQTSHAPELAYAFYRSALVAQNEGNETQAIKDLEVAQQFPGLPKALLSLIQLRLSAIKNDKHSAIREFDKAITEHFDVAASGIELSGEFLKRYGLSQPSHSRNVGGIDEISCIGVYRWAGDVKRNEQWSRLIRQFKKGDPMLPVFFGRLLAEHVRSNQTCSHWTRVVDYIVPVPAASIRTANRGVDIVGKTCEHLSGRLSIPLRSDFLKREGEAERSRFTQKVDLENQYRFNKRNAAEIQNRSVLLLDDVMNRGHTVEVCAARLREFGCSRIVLLVLAQAESSLYESRYTHE